MWNKIKAFFQREPKQEPQPLRIEGVEPAPLTPVPDDAEMAAQALLESLAEKKVTRKSRKSQKKAARRKNDKTSSRNKEEKGAAKDSQPSTLNSQLPKGKEYYQQLSERVREGREMEARMTMRLVAYCEQELKNPLLPEGRIVGLEHDLLQRMDIVEREGGELKRRWQGCLAEVNIRLMSENQNENENEEDNGTTQRGTGTGMGNR